ncbi:MAG TPA: hypothetical protein VFV71_02600 [Burkholderiales bacterium]|nr:hypothetical protein [Burkholderiales bacterium]
MAASFRYATVAVLAVACAGCATGAKQAKAPPGPVIEADVARVIKLHDGTTCTEPAGLAEARQSETAVKLKAVLEADGKAEEAIAAAWDIKPTPEAAEALYFDACRAYSENQIDKAAFEKQRTVYYALRQQLFQRRIKDWEDKKDGIADAGKLCLVILPDADPDHRSFTRVVPADATVGDCAQFAAANGGTEILLGCTAGNWQNTWAKTSIEVKPSEKLQQLTARNAAHAPDPDCGWN